MHPVLDLYYRFSVSILVPGTSLCSRGVVPNNPQRPKAPTANRVTPAANKPVETVADITGVAEARHNKAIIDVSVPVQISLK